MIYNPFAKIRKLEDTIQHQDITIRVLEERLLNANSNSYKLNTIIKQYRNFTWCLSIYSIIMSVLLVFTINFL